MTTYVRFTPEEYKAIRAACRALDLSRPDLFPLFPYFLVRALKDTAPGLADRIARFGPYRVRLLLEHLRAQRNAGASDPGPAARQDLTAEEWRAVSEAARAYLIPPGYPDLFRAFLAHSLRKTAPELSRKVARLGDDLIEQVYARVKAAPTGRV